MGKVKRLNSSCRFALAAMLHDLGKLTERARIEVEVGVVDANAHQYCPSNQDGRFTHKHAAYTAIGIDLLESKGLLPPIKGEELYPFKSWMGESADDSLINAAARHHRPETLLQWIVATADRVASGFEREKFDQYNLADEKTSTGKNHYTARLLTLFEQVAIDPGKEQGKVMAWRYPLQPMSIDAMMPQKREQCEGSSNGAAQKEYHQLWQAFLQGLQQIPKSHRQNLALWMDHFDSCWSVFASAIPSATAFGVRPEVSLYDHTKATTAIATALWGYHEQQKGDEQQVVTAMRNRQDWDDEKILLIQGDLFGIQDFIFSSGGETRKRAAKLLRGRSFYVALMMECAALKILDALGLPSTSQIMNAAGKLMIVAPNTEETLQALERVRNELNAWCLEHAWGEVGIGLAWVAASCNDFIQSGQGAGFDRLMVRLIGALDEAKRQRFNLCADEASTTFDGFLDQFDSRMGVCQVDDHSPARVELEDGVYISALSKDQITIGELLVKKDRLLITRETINHNTLEVDLFGYRVSFTDSEGASGKFGAEAASGNLLRAWDFSHATDVDAPLFHGYARRWINGYVPRFNEVDDYFADKYARLKGEKAEIEPGAVKTLNHIACEDLYLDEGRKGQREWLGVDALMTLKGDIDDLGLIFQQGLKRMTFAKMAALSRQVNGFFAVWLPWYCQKQYPDTYTVFAGGDDFFLIGPWRSQMNLARDLRREFSRYVTGNPQIHFSAGLSMSRPGLPIRYLADRGEHALETAKEFIYPNGDIKNAVTCHGQTVSWDQFEALSEATADLEQLSDELGLSTGYIYGMQSLVEMADNIHKRPENAIWHSRFSYRTRRMVERMRGLNEDERRRIQERITQVLAAKGIDQFKGGYRIALTTYLYKYRKTGV